MKDHWLIQPPPTVHVRVGAPGLHGVLRVPEGALGVVAFAHGSGSSRNSPRNNRVAADFADHGIATLLLDLLTEAEAGDRHKVFDIDLLAERLGAAAAWLAADPRTGALRLGLYGASTGAAAALSTAAEPQANVRAVVSRGGRPDLAAAALGRVRAPTLLIVGGLDTQVLQLNRMAFERLHCPRALEVVDGATHLFEEPGAMEAVTALARGWFLRHLGMTGIGHESTA